MNYIGMVCQPKAAGETESLLRGGAGSGIGNAAGVRLLDLGLGLSLSQTQS